jgi:hypothetical protein
VQSSTRFDGAHKLVTLKLVVTTRFESHIQECHLIQLMAKKGMR